MGLGCERDRSTEQSMYENIIAFYVHFKEQEKEVSLRHPCGS